MKLYNYLIAIFMLFTLSVNAQSEQYLGEIRIFSGNFAPKGWALCNGQLLPINQNQALFSLLGTTYGGNGQTNFALPNLMGKLAMDEGNGHNPGETGGTTSHTLTTAEIPMHTHSATSVSITQNANSIAGNLSSPVGNYYAKNTIRGNEFNSESNATGVSLPLPTNTVGNTGSTQAHTNMQPYAVVTFIIALQGIYPSQN
jgi:microcystin-dependent protein